MCSQRIDGRGCRSSATMTATESSVVVELQGVALSTPFGVVERLSAVEVKFEADVDGYRAMDSEGARKVAECL